MPKKRDGTEVRKSRKSLSSAKDASSSPMGSSDILPPPTPTASHLVASNPFDDTLPSNSMKVMHNFGNQPPMMRMGGGMGPSFPSWAGGPRAGIRPQYSGPGGPNWGATMHGNPNMGPVPGYNPSLSNNGYGHYPGPGLPTYRGAPRMSLSNVRPGLGPMGSPDGEPMMHDPSAMGPNHMVSSGNQGHMLQNTGQMKALTRPTSQMLSPNVRKSSASSNKHLGDSKSPKAADSSIAKQRKKNEKKLNQENKSKSGENERINNNNENIVAPHAIPPKDTQPCQQCSKNIDYPVEDAIRCLASCNKWFHRTCVGLTENALKFLKSEELALWACDACLRVKEIQSLRPRVPLIDGQVASA